MLGDLGIFREQIDQRPAGGDDFTADVVDQIVRVLTAEMLDDRVYGETELRKLLPASVLSELPVIYGPNDEWAQKRKNWMGWAATAGVVAAMLAGSAVSYWKS